MVAFVVSIEGNQLEYREKDRLVVDNKVKVIWEDGHSAAKEDAWHGTGGADLEGERTRVGTHELLPRARGGGRLYHWQLNWQIHAVRMGWEDGEGRDEGLAGLSYQTRLMWQLKLVRFPRPSFIVWSGTCRLANSTSSRAEHSSPGEMPLAASQAGGDAAPWTVCC